MTINILILLIHLNAFYLLFSKHPNLVLLVTYVVQMHFLETDKLASKIAWNLLLRYIAVHPKTNGGY